MENPKNREEDQAGATEPSDWVLKAWDEGREEGPMDDDELLHHRRKRDYDE